MTTLLSIFAALFGLAFGSFLNVCISRLPRHESIVSPGSRCPRCMAAICAADNLPVVSWLLLRGRCRHCRQRIAGRYPLVEVASAGIFLGFVERQGFSVLSIGGILLCWILLGLAVMDIETMSLPDAFTIPGIAAGLAFSGATGGWRGVAGSLLAAVAASLLLLLVRAVYRAVRKREGLGLGDVKLMAMIAAWLGMERGLLALFLGVVAAAVFALTWLAIVRARDASSMKLPLGAFLCAGAAYSFFLGNVTVRWYLGLYGLR